MKRLPSQGELRHVDLAPVLRSGTFVIEGMLNKTFKRGAKTYTQKGFEEPGHHSVACVDGSIVDRAFLSDTKIYPGNKLSVSVLHIKKGAGWVDKEIGFFRHVRKVYRVYKCERKGRGCHGLCQPSFFDA